VFLIDNLHKVMYHSFKISVLFGVCKRVELDACLMYMWCNDFIL